MRFELDFYDGIIRPSVSRKLKYKFEKVLQTSGLVFSTKMDKKLVTIEEVTSAFKLQNLMLLGTHVYYGEDTIQAGKNMYFCKCEKCGLVQRAAFSYIKEGKFNCYGCLIHRHFDEANQHGLELIGPSLTGDVKRRHYRFQCGHKRDISTGDVRLGNFSCTECRSEALQSHLNYYGFELLGRPDKSMCSDPTQFYHVRYKTCGHSRIVTQQCLFGRSVGECSICYEEVLQKTYGDKLGIDVLECVAGTKRKIRFRKCGHEKVVGLSNMKADHFECTICRVSKWSEEANNVSLTYLGAGSGQKHRYRALCGHDMLLKPSTVRVGHWTCRSCDSGYLDRVNYLYLYKVACSDGNSFVKLGYSGNPEYRKYDYSASVGTHFELLKKVSVPTGRDAIRLENLLHSKYKSQNLSKDFVMQYLTESGFTECYPSSVSDNIIKDLTNIELELLQGVDNE